MNVATPMRVGDDGGSAALCPEIAWEAPWLALKGLDAVKYLKQAKARQRPSFGSELLSNILSL